MTLEAQKSMAVAEKEALELLSPVFDGMLDGSLPLLGFREFSISSDGETVTSTLQPPHYDPIQWSVDQLYLVMKFIVRNEGEAFVTVYRDRWRFRCVDRKSDSNEYTHLQITFI